MPQLRTITTAAAAALALLLAIPGSASADISGTFTYSYTDANGTQETVTLDDLTTTKCTDITEVANKTAEFAFAPNNRTDRVVQLFTKRGCGGSKFILGDGTSKPDEPHFASFYFNG
ncbi:hypothetical protein [Streptomyces sp. NPDC037389]|uniref:hypothetical protein n=1 Tax=Streptomyces sp. NPDC037389 TaxID=3155369 RepID=UPI0033C0505F